MIWLTVAGLMALASYGSTRADDQEILDRLREKGAKVTGVDGSLSISVGNCGKMTDMDFQDLGSLPRVTNLSLAAGYKESSLYLLAGLRDLEAFATNGVSDEGVTVFLQFPKLKRLSFYHTSFTGAGLAQLAELKQFEDLTIGGSADARSHVGDEALGQISEIKSLKRLRIYHLMNTNAGIKRLQELPVLEALTLGQAGAHSPRPCPNDETIALLLEMRSLKSLALAESRFGYDSLARLQRHPALTQLTLLGVDISEADVERLRSDMPNVRIKVTGPSAENMNLIRRLFGSE